MAGCIALNGRKRRNLKRRSRQIRWKMDKMGRIIRLRNLIITLIFVVMAIALSAHGQLTASRMIADLNPGPAGSYPTNFYVYKGTLVFNASTAATGSALWGFDGTNIYLIKDVDSTGGFATYNGALYFSGYEPTNGQELYKYDGTNTVRVTDINPGAGSSSPQQLTVMNNVLFFSANSGTSKPNYELWKYDGVAATQVTNIHPDSGSDFSSYPTGLTAFNGSLYFSADDGTHGYELWKASSTNAVLLADINPGGESSSSYPQYFTPFRNKLYFQAYNATYGYELWTTDGTNTSLVADINPGLGSSYPQNLTVFNNALYFQATDGIHGAQLWKYDGAVVSLVSNINLSADSFPQNLTVFSNWLFFSANDGIHGYELWKCDGTNAALVTDLNPSGDSFPEELIVFNNALYFVATTPATGYEWWQCDGNKVTLAADINPGAGSSYPESPAVYNSTLCFSAANDGVSNWEPWTIWLAPFQINSIQRLSGGFQLKWETVGGRTNIVQSSDAIDGTFTNLSPPIIIQGSGGAVTNYVDATGASSRFYRIIQP
jgi:ELWxxDGT repeat protein